jgi:replicative DNA helicase
MGVITIEEEITIGDLFKKLKVDKQGEYEVPSSLKVYTENGYKKVEGLIKTQPNEEWFLETENGFNGVFADFHKVEATSGFKDVGKKWKTINSLKVGDEINTELGFDKIKNVYFNGKKSKMYDLQVEGKHFYTNGIVSHNTGFLGNFAINAFLNGKKVLVYSFETSRERLAMRYYANLVNMDKKEILADEDVFKNKSKKILNEMEGDLIIKEYNANSVCANDLMAHIQDLKRYLNWEPDIVVIDYLLIMLTNDKKMSSENSYKYYKTITEEVRNIGKSLNIPILTATQINREGMSDRGGSKSFITSKDISESRGIFDTSDWFAIITQTTKDKEKNKYYLYIDKSRNDRTGIRIEYNISYDFMRLEEGAVFNS